MINFIDKSAPDKSQSWPFQKRTISSGAEAERGRCLQTFMRCFGFEKL
jgi:hypothetical protein